MGDVSWVNDTSIIRQNPKVTAINSAVEIDITGQVVSDSIGSRFLSGEDFAFFSFLSSTVVTVFSYQDGISIGLETLT